MGSMVSDPGGDDNRNKIIYILVNAPNLLYDPSSPRVHWPISSPGV
jgi:hypothetical protein